MTYSSSNLYCPYCGTQLSEQEVEYVQGGISVRCRECGSILTKDSFQATRSGQTEGPTTTPSSYSPQYQPPPQRGNGTAIFFIGFIVFSLGLYSWVFWIPIFDLTYYGEILGAIAVVKGLSDLRKELPNQTGFMIMVGGVLVWIIAWISWIIYVPIFSEGFIGEFGGLGLIIFGYLTGRRY